MDKLFEAQLRKVDLQTNIHKDNMIMQRSRIRMENKKMKREGTMLRLQEEKLRGDIIADVTKHNFDTLKKRLEMKAIDMSLTEEYLDTILPFCKVPYKR